MNCQNVSDDGKSNQWRYYNKAAMVHGVFEYFVRFNINLIIKFYFYVEYIYLYIYVISCTMFVRVIVSHDIISWFILLLVCLTFGAGVLRIITVSNTLKKMSSYSVYSARSIWGEHVTLTNYRISQTTSNIIINVLNELESLFNIWINNPIRITRIVTSVTVKHSPPRHDTIQQDYAITLTRRLVPFMRMLRKKILNHGLLNIHGRISCLWYKK